MGDFEEEIARKRVTPAPKDSTRAPAPKGKTGKEALSNVARTSLLNAQHWIEKGIATLRKGTDPDWKQLFELIHLHVEESLASFGKGNGVERSAVAPQLARTLNALKELSTLHFDTYIVDAKFDPKRRYYDHVAKPTWVSLYKQQAMLGIQELPVTRSRAPASKGDDAYEIMALAAVLELLEVGADVTLDRLRTSKSGHVQIVQAASVSMLQHAQHAVKLAALYQRNDEGKQVGVEIDRASQSVINLWRWIFGRENNHNMLASFSPVMKSLDVVRAEARLGSVMTIKPEDIPATQVVAEKQELDEVQGAKSSFEVNLQHLQTGVETGTHQFMELVKLEDPPTPGTLWKELAKGLLISVVGNLIGPGLGLVVSRLAKLGEATTSTVSGMATDTAQSWANTVFDEAGQDSSGSDKAANTRDALLFSTTVLRSKAEGVKQARDSLNEHVSAHRISASEISTMSVSIGRSATDAVVRTKNELARGFALFLAQRGLGKENGVTQIGTADEYFGAPRETVIHRIGEHLPLHLPPTRANGKNATPGIAKLVVAVDSSKKFEVKSVTISGMNRDMASAVVDRAGFHIDRLGLPTEIEFDVPWAVTNAMGVAFKRELPKVIVDEAGNLRAAIAWELFSEVKEIVGAFATPETAWSAVRAESIPTRLFPHLVQARTPSKAEPPSLGKKGPA